jgi:hypothetical protein
MHLTKTDEGLAVKKISKTFHELSFNSHHDRQTSQYMVFVNVIGCRPLRRWILVSSLSTWTSVNKHGTYRIDQVCCQAATVAAIYSQQGNFYHWNPDNYSTPTERATPAGVRSAFPEPPTTRGPTPNILPSIRNDRKLSPTSSMFN